MRVKLLRSLGTNLPEAKPEEADALAKAHAQEPLTEGHIRDLLDAVAHWLIRHGLAEEVKPEPKGDAAKTHK